MSNSIQPHQTIAPLPNSVKPEYSLSISILMCIVFAFYMLVFTLNFFFTISDDPTALFSLNTYRLAPQVLLLGLMAYISVSQYFLTKRLYTNRQRALYCDQSLLASEQPQPLERLPEFPFVIEHKITLWSCLFTILLVLTCVALYWLLLAQFNPVLANSIWIKLSSIIIVIVLFLFICYQRRHTKIIATQDGLHIKQWSKERFINWHDVRLFAIDYDSILNKQGPPQLFELASENNVIQWYNATSKTILPLMSPKPTLPPDQYNQRMQQLLSLTVSITKQPLYDLRKNKHIPIY